MPQPREWLDLLERRLDERWKTMEVFDAYYEGDHKLSFATAKFREAFGSVFGAIADNWMQIVVDSAVERLRVQGFRFGKQDADDEAWDIWQANGLDAESNMVHTEAVKLGESYWLVAPGDPPRITAEHPSQVIVACAPGDRRVRQAALKRWLDTDGSARANVYLPDRVVKYRKANARVLAGIQNSEWVTLGQEPNPLGVVPVVPMRNNPSMLRGGRSDLAGGAIDVQNAVNKLLSDMLIGSEYQAYPQRVVLGIPPPTTEQQRQDAIKSSQARLWYFDGENIDIKEFAAADLENYGKAMDRLVRHLTAQTKTPPHYVVGEIVNASGDALKAAETGLVSKVKDKMDPFGEGHEEAMRLAFLAIDRNDPRAEATDAETIWRDPESRSEAETVDAAVKLASIGVPQEALWERIGASPQEIDRWKSLQEAEALIQAAQQPVLPQPPMNGNRAEQPAEPALN